MFASGAPAGARFEELERERIDLHLHGSVLPLHLAGRLRAPLSLLRSVAAARAVARAGHALDVVISTHIPHALPLLRRLNPALRLVQYCHFPDLLLTRPGGAAYRLYRRPIDRLEARGLACADAIVVNSAFTAAAVARAFPGLPPATVVHPGVDVGAWMPARLDRPRTTLVTIGRFDPDKNAALAVEAFAALRQRIAADQFQALTLVIAGGLDPRLASNVETYRHVRDRVTALALDAQVQLHVSPGTDEVRTLVAESLCVVHPHEAEHFGIVPVEAMASGRPVVAVAHGGPLETIVHGETGLLAAPTPDGFADALAVIVTNPDLAERMGVAGRTRAVARFSSHAFGQGLEAVLSRIMSAGPA